MSRKGERGSLQRVDSYVAGDIFGDCVAQIMAWPCGVNPVGKARWEDVFVETVDVQGDSEKRHGLFGTESVRQANTGVQRNCLPHRGNPILGHCLLAKEVRRGIGSLDFEPLVAASVIGDAEIMQDATEEDDFV